MIKYRRSIAVDALPEYHIPTIRCVPIYISKNRAFIRLNVQTKVSYCFFQFVFTNFSCT